MVEKYRGSKLQLWCFYYSDFFTWFYLISFISFLEPTLCIFVTAISFLLSSCLLLFFSFLFIFFHLLLLFIFFPFLFIFIFLFLLLLFELTLSLSLPLTLFYFTSHFFSSLYFSFLLRFLSIFLRHCGSYFLISLYSLYRHYP